MDSEEIPTFSSPKEETAYWKELSLKYKQRYWDSFAGWAWFLMISILLNLSLQRCTKMGIRYFRNNLCISSFKLSLSVFSLVGAECFLFPLAVP